MSVHAFTLPNGKNLSYAWPHQATGGQFNWKRSYLTPKLINHKAKNKERQIRIGLWTSRSSHYVMCADFDILPAGFDDWECFFNFAKATWGKMGFIYRSFNQKVKILFVGEVTDKSRMCKQYAFNFLKEKIGYEFSEYLDLTSGAVSTSFINGFQVERLGKWLLTAPVFEIDTTIEVHQYLQGDSIPLELQEFIDNSVPSQREAREKFILILLKMHNLNLEGFDLPTTKIGKQCGVVASRISEWRNELVEMGWLRLTDDSYCKGFKGMTYRARGLLRRCIYAVMKGAKKVLKAPQTLPSDVADGTWEQTFWEYSKYFVKSPEAFLNWALQLPRVKYKKRFKKAFRAMNSRLKYARLEKLAIPRMI